MSISNDFSPFSRSLIVEFLRNNHYDPVMARYISPRKKFNLQVDRRVDSEIIIDTAERDISRVEKVVSDVDSGYRIPVLLKKYLEMNGRIIGFNVDPDFNNCLDGLIMLDIYNFPAEFVKALSRDHERGGGQQEIQGKRVEVLLSCKKKTLLMEGPFILSEKFGS
ncbi:MAG: hypothetical protein MZV63_52475 [Marinilabiliales bacterium]|nr:hypothetical protein [Marinilabiliales bacterium]